MNEIKMQNEVKVQRELGNKTDNPIILYKHHTGKISVQIK